MSGGDGIGHGTGFQGGSGGINGHSGPGGPNSGHDTPYSDHSGWSSENNGWQPGIGGQGWNGHSGDHDNNGGKNQPNTAFFGTPALVPATAGGINLTAFGRGVLKTALTEALISSLPGVATQWGIGALLLGFPTSIAKDDPNMMSKITVAAVPAKLVTETHVESLPLAQATVSVQKRVVDVVKDEKQHLAVVKTTLPTSVPVVHAKPTKTPHVYSASVPGLPHINITLTTSPPTVKPADVPKGLTSEKGTLNRPAGYQLGGNTHDFIVRFPDKDKQDSLYLSVTKPLTKDELKRRQDEENKRQRAWEETHPVEVAQRRYGEAVADLNNTVKKIGDMQAKLPGIVAATAKAKKVSEQKLSGFPGYKDVLKKIKKQYQDALKYEADFRTELATTIESRKAKEKNVSDKKKDIEEAKKKPRKGTTQEGHSYHPTPKDNELKGFGEVKRGKDKTPKQGGGGVRRRWIADKGKTILEWDSQHGEVEKYDKQGNHKGSFDHRTGKQLKGPVPGRNIKNYL